MVNSYIDYVKEWRKSNPDVSYKDALKEASADYKNQKSSTINNSEPKSKSKSNKSEPKSKKIVGLEIFVYIKIF